MRIHPLAFITPVLTLGLTGCPQTSLSSMPVYPIQPKYPMPSPAPIHYPVTSPSVAPGYAPSPGPGTILDPMNGLSIHDAYHQVQRYVVLHYPGAALVSVQASPVSTAGRISTTGNWAFTFQMTEASPAPTASRSLLDPSVEIPSQFETRYLAFTLTGGGQILAPEAKTRLDQGVGTIAYERVIPLSKALEIAQSFGMRLGAGGVSVALKPDFAEKAVYELDNSLTEPYLGSPARGLYMLNAYTGSLVKRPGTSRILSLGASSF